MNPQLVAAYERELAFFAESAEDFQRKFIAGASHLLPDPLRVPDPHLDRLIQAFALLAGRIHLKLDDEFPILTASLTEIVAPHLNRLVPSMAIARVEMDPKHPPSPDGYHLPVGTVLHTRPLGNPPIALTYRLGYPVSVWPIHLTNVQVTRNVPASAPLKTAGLVRFEFEMVGGTSLAQVPLDHLRFHVEGDPQLLASLYEVLFHHVTRVVIRDRNNPGKFVEATGAKWIRPVGLDLEEGILPWPSESFLGYRLLTEFLAFPKKFHFFDLAGWPEARSLDMGPKIEVLFFLGRLPENVESGISPRTFLLGCSPVINLFEKSAEPIAQDEIRPEYRVVPSRQNPMAMEVYDIEDVVAVSEGRATPTQFRPFFHYDLGETGDGVGGNYHVVRRPSDLDDDNATEVYLFLFDREQELAKPADAVLDVRCLCTNRNYPFRFQRGTDHLYLTPQSPKPLSAIRFLNQPTPAFRPPIFRNSHWRLLSQMGLNHQSYTDPNAARQHLRETLRLCDPTGNNPDSIEARINRQIIDSLTEMKSRSIMIPVPGPQGVHFCQGTQIQVAMDEKMLVGVGAMLFSNVLDRYFSLAASLNSFTQLQSRTIQGEFSRTWPPRSANHQLA